MFKQILVPLDGSQLAEAALPVAVKLAIKLQASVTLIHIIEKNPPQEIHGQHHLTNPEEALAYLHTLATNAFPPSVRVSEHVHTTEESDVARSIVQHAGEFTPDLIVMCAHGHGGLRDILVGRIAQQVIAQGYTPVLLVQPDLDKPVEFECKHLLVPIDGKPGHEQSLPVSRDLAAACDATVNLLTVIPTLGTLGGQQAATGRLLPGTMSALLDINVAEAEHYLEAQAGLLSSAGIPHKEIVLRGDPAPTIAEFASSHGTDLIILGTHGRKGVDAFWAGSVAPKLISQTQVPLLFVPV